MSREKMPTDIDQLIHDALHGQASDADRQRLSDWIVASEDNAKAYLRVAMDERAILASMERDASRSLDELDDSAEATGAGMILAELAKAEALVDAPLVELIDLRTAWWQEHAGPLFAAAGVAFAALIALAVILLVQDPEPTDLVNQAAPARQAAPIDRPTRDAQTPVATITATHNAKWSPTTAERASARGSHVNVGAALRPGQRLTLTAGFAEITTHRGAIAILEGPCVVELKDNDNGLRLVSGKLVGICETESSKGFLVSTPHMDITDLGTRFGVDASQVDATEVHVFEGEVQADRPGSAQVLLVAEQSARAVADDDTIAAIHHDTSRFAAIRDGSGLGTPSNKTVLHNDTDGRQWLIAPSEHAGPIAFNGNKVVCTVNNEGFGRNVAQGNAYGFIQYQAGGAGLGKPATAVGSWTLANLPAGRYDVATAFEPREGLHAGGRSIRYTVNGVVVEVDQSAIPAPDAGPTFTDGIRKFYQRRPKIDFTLIGSSVVVPDRGSITITIDNANHPTTSRALMDSIAISLVPEGKPK